jgi:hypothetical protein
LVKYGLVTLVRETADLCDTVKDVQLEFLLEENKETTLSKEVDLPGLPTRRFTVMADLVNKACNIADVAVDPDRCIAWAARIWCFEGHFDTLRWHMNFFALGGHGDPLHRLV